MKLPQWFDVKNYDSAKNWTASDWSNAIFNRVLISNLLHLPENDFFLKLITRFLRNDSNNLQKNSPYSWIETIKELHLHPRGIEKSRIKLYKLKLKPVEPATLKLIAFWTEQATEDLTEEVKDYLYGRKVFPVSDETLAISKKTVEDRNIENGMIASEWGNSVFARINLSLPKKLILEHVSELIDESRKKYKIEHMAKPPSNFDFKLWTDAQILGYFDLQLILEINGFSLTHEQIGKRLFPNEYDVSLADRVRKVTKPTAEVVFQDATCLALDSVDIQE